MKMGHILFTSILLPKGVCYLLDGTIQKYPKEQGGQFCHLCGPGSPAITGHQRDVEGFYMVLNAREPAIYAMEWTLGW
jgi:hypothetical protein